MSKKKYTSEEKFKIAKEVLTTNTTLSEIYRMYYGDAIPDAYHPNSIILN